MRKVVTISLPEDVYFRLKGVVRKEGYKSLSYLIRRIVAIWESSRGYEQFQKKNSHTAFWRAFDEEVKKHPERYYED